MTDKEIVEKAKEAEKRTGFGELVHSPISKGVNSAYGIGFIEGMVEYRNSLQEEPIILTEEILKKNGFLLKPRPRYNPPYWSKLFTASDGRGYLCKINMEQKIREILMTVDPSASNDGSEHPTCYLPHPKTIQQLEKSLRLFNIKYVIEV